jgi:two-component system OmpR family response regulator
MLPDMDGLEVCRRVRAMPGEVGKVAILMLTAKGDPMDRIVGLELGADDYLAKPFSPRELLARLRAVLRRSELGQEREQLVVGEVSVDLGSRRASVGERDVELTGLEFDLLVALMRRAGRVVPRSMLLELAGRSDVTVNDRAVDVHISHLRRKLGDDPPRWIKTVRGVGYVMAKA